MKQVILFVDDDESITAISKQILTEAGHYVLGASSGNEAHALLGIVSPDLLITDLVMPDLEGLELIRLVVKSRPDLRVIPISGEFEMLFLKVAEAFGAKATLQKPFSPNQLVETASRVTAMD